MKLFIIAGLIVLSAAASAQTCKLEMYGEQGEFITSIRTADDPECSKAAIACRNWRDWYYAPAGSQCYIVEDNGYATIDYVRFPDYDVYYGYPGSPYSRVPRTPPTEPTPTSSPESDAIRAIEAGETVIFNSALHMVVSIASNNFYNLKPMTGRERDREIVKDVARQYVAITRGCHAGFCANESVIVVSSSSYAAVAGIEYDGQLVTKSISRPEVMSFDVNPSALAWTKGCSPEGRSKVCVGNVVMKGRAYYTVAGIQTNGAVVIESNDRPKKLTVNVNPSELLIVNNH